MNAPVYAFGFDSADPDLVQTWMDQGALPNFLRLKKSGTFTRLETKTRHLDQIVNHGSTDSAWVMFQTGVTSKTSGFWDSVDFDQENYCCSIDSQHGNYDDLKHDPFYSWGDHRVATFDIPYANVCPNVNGIQLTGWGGHFPFVDRASQPPGLLEEINNQYGENNILYKDHGVFWNRRYLHWLEKASIESIRLRTKICKDLIERDDWDLFLAVFGEAHGAIHDLLFASDKSHPLSHVWTGDHDPLLSVFQELDRAVGELLDSLKKPANIVCFSVHGMKQNVSDLGSLFFLAELMYRFNFPGRYGFAKGTPGAALREPYTSGRHWYWFGEIWRRRYSKYRLVRQLRDLLPGWLVWPPGKHFHFPYSLDWFGAQAGWIPAVWYQKAWPQMRSFALPNYSDGHIRINLQGREAQGIVRPEEYGDECKKITDFLLATINPRTGKSVVKQVVATREDPLKDDSHLINADLIVVWDHQPFDVLDNPLTGRVGPVHYNRTGGHRNCGFMLADGPDINPGNVRQQGSVLDLAPTFLSLMGADLPEHLEGSSLLNSSHSPTWISSATSK